MSIEKNEGYNVLSEGIEEKKLDKSKTYIVWENTLILIYLFDLPVTKFYLIYKTFFGLTTYLL